MPPDPTEPKRGTSSAPPTAEAEQGATDASDLSADEELDELGELDGSSAEFHSINESLDSLSSALDIIERKNDSLREQLLLLLESQRDTLKSFKEENGRQAEQEEPASEPSNGAQQSRQPAPAPGEPMEQS